ncbi:MAG TPA: biotin/lipoyl-containing protein, partial [Chitinivibrionales bacterium]|nr:biotin/lipoyl-containing protein [Chitinivibrionales bacterium]
AGDRHAGTGVAISSYVEGVRAGAGAIDCAIAAMAGTSSQPPVETMAAIFSETDYHADLNRDAMLRVHRYFADLYAQRNTDTSLMFCIDPQILIHQIPGGMISNFRSQLVKQNALDKLEDALTEVTRVREDLGWPPLVTPTSQIVGTQAVMNVLAGERYKIVPNEVKDYFRGLYGRAPGHVNPELAKKILGDEKPIMVRPGDTIAPMLPKATEGIDPKYIKNEEDIISYCILPEPSLEYFKWRDMPPDKRPETPADLELKKLSAAAEKKTSATAEKKEEAPFLDQILHPDDYRGLGELLNRAGGLRLDELTVKKGDFSLSLKSDTTRMPVIPKPVPAAAPGEAPARKEGKPAETGPAAAKDEKSAPLPAAGPSIKAPLVGAFYSTSGPSKPKLVNVGDVVEAGTKVCIVEAMKLFNEIVAPVKCKILQFLVEDGTMVEKNQPLIAIEEIK